MACSLLLLVSDGGYKMRIAQIENVTLSDGSLVHNVIIKNGLSRVARLECESFDSAQAIINAINYGTTGIVTL